MPLDHVGLHVLDRERSAAFYGEHFGLTERVHDDDDMLILSDEGGSLLALFERSRPDPPGEHFHFGMRLARPADVHAARERLRGAGVAEHEWQESGPTRVQVLDPDGYRVELYAF